MSADQGGIALTANVTCTALSNSRTGSWRPIRVFTLSCAAVNTWRKDEGTRSFCTNNRNHCAVPHAENVVRYLLRLQDATQLAWIVNC